MALSMINLLGGLPQSMERNDDDLSDRMNHRFTVSLLVVLSIVISTKTYVGDRIQCWHPAHFSDSWNEYTDSYCWIKDTYNLPFSEHIPRPHEGEKRERLSYYQWVPIILLAQAFLFYAPIIVWRSLNERSGCDVNTIIETAEKFTDLEKAKDGKKESFLEYMTTHMHRYLMSRNTEVKKDCVVGCTHLVTMLCFKCSRARGTYLIPLYCVTKLLFVATAVGQLLFLNMLFGDDYHFYGFKFLMTRWREQPFVSDAFPRVTMCDVYVRRLGNLQRYTMQCVLPINLFNETVFLIVWFWIVGVTIGTILTLFSWLSRTVPRTERHEYVRRHLHLLKSARHKTTQETLKPTTDEDETAPATPESDDSIVKTPIPETPPKPIVPEYLNYDKAQLARFVDKYLKADGVFVLRLIQHNTNSITVDEFVLALWEKYKKDQPNSDNPTYQPI